MARLLHKCVKSADDALKASVLADEHLKSLLEKMQGP